MVEDLKKLLRDDKLLTQAATSSFMQADANRSGSINEKELSQVMSSVCSMLGVSKPTSQQIKDLMKKIDKNRNGQVNFDEYLVFLKLTLKKHIDKVEGVHEETLRITQKNDDDLEKRIGKQTKQFESYLEKTGLPAAFEVIYTEILAKKIEPDKVFTYTATRLRQIGKEIAHLLPKEYTTD